MAKNNTWALALLNLLFCNIPAAKIGNAAGMQGSSVAGSLYFSLHTADPGVGGNQSTSEVAYTGYARVAVPRSAQGFSAGITTGTGGAFVNPVNNIDFPVCTGTTNANVATYFAVGTDPTGAGEVLYSGTITPSETIVVGSVPRLTPATAVLET